MSKRINILNNVITYLITIACFFMVVFVGSSKVADSNLWAIVLATFVGVIVAGIITTFFHEIGHLVGGKLNGFVFVSMSILFFKWEIYKGKRLFSFVMPGDELGYTEMISKSTENIAKRYKNMTGFAILFTFIPTIIGIIPLFINSLSLWPYCLWGALLPIGVFSILDNGLPTSSMGVRNDGAIIYGLNKMDDQSKVLVNLLSIQSEMLNGKTPAEIDEKFYFDLPQLGEDEINFFLLLNARYNYFLDKGDFENAKKTTDRLLSLNDYAQEAHMLVAKIDALYNYCTFDFDENKADDLMYELEGYLNKRNSCTNLRVKMAYILFVAKENYLIEDFYVKAKKEALNCQIKGYGAFELKLIEKLRQNSPASTVQNSMAHKSTSRT